METPGHYVFAPAGTPCLEGLHNYGSRNWTTDDDRPLGSLGESLTARHIYSRGEPPDPYPSSGAIGSGDCLAGGGLPPESERWEFTAEGGCYWLREDNRPRLHILDSANCGGVCNVRQHGRGILNFTATVATVLTLTLRASVERQDLNFDLGQVLVDGEVVASVGGTGERLHCAMADVSSSATISLDAGPHTLVFTGDTVDELFHVGCFFEADIEFVPDLGHDERIFVEGFDSRCYGPSDARHRWDIGSRGVVLLLAQVLDLFYTNPTAAGNLLLAGLGPGATVDVVPNSASLVPGTVVGQAPDISVVCISGTSNFQQLAAQIAYATSGPVSVGTYSTNLQWNSSEIAVHTRLNALAVNPALPIVLCGHSYGAAIATLLAGDYITFLPNRAISLLTFGCPKVGDSRLAARVKPLRRRHVADEGDLVPGLPPGIDELLPLVAGLPGALVASWLSSARMGAQVILQRDGLLLDSDDSVLSYLDILNMIPDLVAGNPLPPIDDHQMSEYLRRLTLTPP